jgi:hypothetical protein
MDVPKVFREFINECNVVGLPGSGSASSFTPERRPATIPSRRPSGLVYMPGFQPISDSIDTLAEATLNYTFI